MKILTNLTSTALWYDIIQDAEAFCSVVLKEELESYLVFLLMRHCDKPGLVKRIVASELMQGMQLAGSGTRSNALREVGDICLLLSGLYPGAAEKRLVKLSYFVNLGKIAYTEASIKNNDLYKKLSNHFVSLMDVLQSIRQQSQKYPNLLPLQAYELWHETGSKRAFDVLQQYTTGQTSGCLLKWPK